MYNWLETVINFWYYIFASPFKVNFNPATTEYNISKSSFRTLIALAIHFFGLLVTSIGLYEYTFTSRSLRNPKCVFHAVVKYSQYVIYYALIFTLFTRKSHFENFFQTFRKNSNHVDNSRLNEYAKPITLFLCLLMIVSAITIEVMYYNYSEVSGFNEYIALTFNTRIGARKFEKLFRFRKDDDGSNTPGPGHMMGGNFTLLPPPHGPPPISQFEFLLTTFYDSLKVYIRVCNHVAMLSCILAGITLHQAASRFLTEILKEKDPKKIISKYIDFSKFGSCLNNMCGYIVLSTVICSPPFYIVYFIGVFADFEYNAPRVIFYSVMYCCVYIVAAEASSKIGEFKEWIIQSGNAENESQLFAIFTDLSENPMGLRGMGCFTVTYGFLSQMFALIVTFTIILMQFETTPENPTLSIQCVS